MRRPPTPKIPAPIASYFALFGITSPPLIAQTYHPDHGWRTIPYRAHVDLSDLRAIRRKGCTFVALAAGGHLADFNLQEFF